MKPAHFRYARPRTLEDILALLAACRGEAKLLAGGQSLLPMLNMRLARPAVLIDLALVTELQVLAREGDELVVGAGVRQRSAETSTVVRDSCPLLPLALRYVGHLQTRNRGTIGGSLVHADPAAELPGVAVALDASLVAVGPGGRRIIAARDFFLGPYTTGLGADEVLTEMRLPVLSDVRYAFLEVAQRSAGPAIVGVAAAVKLSDGRKVAKAQLAAVGVSSSPLRLTWAEEAARDTDLGPADRARIAAAAVEQAEETNGQGLDAGYRCRVMSALVSQALAEVAT
jgi:CO/xanthine dehydrogenase FAD-binding subunit